MTNRSNQARIFAGSTRWPPLLPAALLFLSLNLFGQNPPYAEAFIEGGGSFINGGNGTASQACIAGILPCPTVPLIIDGSYTKTGSIFTGVRVRFTHRHAFEFGYSFSPNRLRVTQPGSTFDFGPGFNRVHNFDFNYAGYLISRGPLQPFVTAGLVINKFTQSNFTNGNQVGFDYGGGLDVSLIKHLELRLEVRDIVAGQPVPIHGTSHDLVPSAGLVFRFK